LLSTSLRYTQRTLISRVNDFNFLSAHYNLNSLIKLSNGIVPEATGAESAVKKLRLQSGGLKSRLSRSVSSSSKVRTSSQSTDSGLKELPSVLGLEKIIKPQDLASTIVQLTPRIISRSLVKDELNEIIYRLTEFGNKKSGDPIIKSQVIS